MAEVKYYNGEIDRSARYTVRGGKRETNYDDLKSCIKRVKALRKQGMVIGTLYRLCDGSYKIWMTTPNMVECDAHCGATTPGYQEFRCVPVGGDESRIRCHANIRGANVARDL